MPSSVAPTRENHTFQGYYSEPNGIGIKYYYANMVSAKIWDIAGDRTLYAYWKGIEVTVTFDKQDGTSGSDSVIGIYGQPMPTIGVTPPTKTGKTFKGYFEFAEGQGSKYYDGPTIASVNEWDKTKDTILYAYWVDTVYTVILDPQGGENGTTHVSVACGNSMPTNINGPTKDHYILQGYYTGINGTGIKYYNYNSGLHTFESVRNWDVAENTTLYAYYILEKYLIQLSFYSTEDGRSIKTAELYYLTYNEKKAYNAPNIGGYKFNSCKRTWRTLGGPSSEMYSPSANFELKVFNGSATYFSIMYDVDACVTEGTLITLADGTQKPVELLSENEMLLVWNLKTGTFDTAPMLFIDSDPTGSYKVINLYFSDGTIVKVISEHAFWNIDLNRYVYLRSDAGQYIGHWFNKQIIDASGNMTWTAVQLTNVVVATEITSAWSPVTAEHLSYYVNGMLTMPGGITGLFNIFEVNAATMKYDQEAMQANIEEYGLFTYEEFAEIFPVSQAIFNAFDAQYFKIAIGKGILTEEILQNLIESYSEFFPMES